jgi:hypothetical protein
VPAALIVIGAILLGMVSLWFGAVIWFNKVRVVAELQDVRQPTPNPAALPKDVRLLRQVPIVKL